MSRKNRIRLFAYTPLETGGIYEATEAQTHYLSNVMRLGLDDEVFLFDGVHGEFLATVAQKTKKNLILKVNKKIFDFEKAPDVWLLFAVLKKDNTDIVVQKAVELGARKIIPVRSEYTTASNIKPERLKAQIIEAAEQSRRQDLPELGDFLPLEKLLKTWPQNRKLVYLDETGQGRSFSACAKQMKEPVAFLVGPEGGFSSKELELLKSLSYTSAVSLGHRILRAETASLAALSCWQAFCGDWK